MIAKHLTKKEINQRIKKWRKSMLNIQKRESEIKNKTLILLKLKRLKKKRNQCTDLKILKHPTLKKHKLKMKVLIKKKNNR